MNKSFQITDSNTYIFLTPISYIQLLAIPYFMIDNNITIHELDIMISRNIILIHQSILFYTRILIVYTVKPLYKKPIYRKNLLIRKLFTHLVGIQPFPH